jgi:hypothetical protein
MRLHKFEDFLKESTEPDIKSCKFKAIKVGKKIFLRPDTNVSWFNQENSYECPELKSVDDYKDQKVEVHYNGSTGEHEYKLI